MSIKVPTTKAILKAAFTLYREKPSASLAEIAQYAGIGRATLHRHFKGRNELLAALADNALTEIDTVATAAASDAQSYTEALALIMYALIPLADQQWFLSREAMSASTVTTTKYQQQLDEMYELIESAKNEGTIEPSLPTVWVATTFDSLLFSAWEMINNGEATIKQAGDLAWDTFIKGVHTKGNRE